MTVGGERVEEVVAGAVDAVAAGPEDAPAVGVLGGTPCGEAEDATALVDVGDPQHGTDAGDEAVGGGDPHVATPVDEHRAASTFGVLLLAGLRPGDRPDASAVPHR